jgi:hypothetical protein
MKLQNRIATIINDCRDDNARVRQQIRLGSLLGCHVNFLGVKNDIEAGLNLLDVLDAPQGESIVLINIAPRNGQVRKNHENGTPFCHFEYAGHHVFSTLDGLALSLVKHLELVKEVQVFDIKKCAPVLQKEGWISASHAKRMVKTQFRSFDFLPFAAAFIAGKGELPHQISCDIPDRPAYQVAVVDCFGNCKTTLLPEDVGFRNNKRIAVNGRTLQCYKQLRSVPNGELGLVIGSSGFGKDRFLEIVIQGGHAASKLGLESESPITIGKC